MAATTATLSSTRSDTTTSTSRQLRRTGAVAGVTAAAATVAVAGVADAIGVPISVGGEPIPLLGFAQMTLIATAIGVVLASVLARRAARARHTFVTTTLVLTALSFVPDVLADATTATKLTLILTHVVAAAIVIPSLARRLDG